MVNGRLGDAVPDHRVDGATENTERRFVEARQIQLGLGCGQRIDGQFRPHERKQVRRFRGLPFEVQVGGRRRLDLARALLDVPDRDRDVGRQFDTGHADVQPGRHGSRTRGGSLRRRLEHRERIPLQCNADLVIGVVYVVVAPNLAALGHLGQLRTVGCRRITTWSWRR